MSSEPSDNNTKTMRANRKVVESTCSICGQGFTLGDEVYACAQCGGFHHVPCWDARHSCARVELSGDEKNCPSCGQVIKKEALKCRHCGVVLNAAMVSRIEPPSIPPDAVEKINKLANQSLMWSIVGIFICQPILQPIAISKSLQVTKQLDSFPDDDVVSSARGKARTAKIIAIVVLVLWVVAVFVGIVSQ